MHVVTKALVLLCIALAVLLSALTMSYASNADTITRSMGSAQDYARAMEAKASTAVADHAIAMANADENIRNAEAAMNAAERDKAQLALALNEQRAELAATRARADTTSNQIGQLAATEAQLTELVTAYRGEIERIRTELLDSSKREIQLVDRINELESQGEVLQQTARALQEQLEEANYQLELARSGGTGAEVADASGTFESLTPIRCSVADVFKSPAGYDMATITEGLNGGVRERMKMNIVSSDGNKFIGNLIVVHVEPQQAVGRIDYLGQKQNANQGDTVLSSLN